MRIFSATTEGQNRLGLRELLERYANEQWVAKHLLPHRAAHAVLEAFKSTAAGQLKLLELECREA